MTTSAELIERFVSVRGATERLAAPLSAEDQGLQSMPSCSPTKWHRAHTTWFFEKFLLEPAGEAPHHPGWGVLFNSYYVSVGDRHPRPRRGLLSRPSADEISGYRRAVDERVVRRLQQADAPAIEALRPVVELGLAHEEQHQELLLTDILHALHQNPLRPAYRAAGRAPARPVGGPPGPPRFTSFEGGLQVVGAPAGGGFCFDNEGPRHRVFLEPFALADRLVTVGEGRAFCREGGYETPSLWLSEGYDWARAGGLRAPLYLDPDGAGVFGFDGPREADDDEPLTHVSYYEADAIARFLGARLPTEAEWEVAAASAPGGGNFLEDDFLRALPHRGGPLAQLFGDAWEWTSSSYSPYPGYRPAAGALGEYNGKFMVNQQVLRGGSCLTPRRHIRPSYRNFWHPDTRFQMTGIRLARSGRG